MTGTMVAFLAAFLSLALTGCATTRAPIGQAAPASPAGPVGIIPDFVQIGENIDTGHTEASRMAGALIDWVDKIFGEPRLEDRERKVVVKAGVETTFNDNGESTDTVFRVTARVPMPSLERKTSLFFDIGGDVDRLGDVTSPTYGDANDTYALAATLVQRVRDLVDMGIKVRGFWDSGPDLMLSPFVRYDARQDPWRLFFEQRVSYDTQNEWRADTDLDIDNTISPSVVLRLHNSSRYQFNEPGVNFAHGLMLRHPLFGNSGLSWEWWVEYGTGADVDKTYGRVRMRGRFWRKWIEYELRPAYTFPLEGGRDPFFSFFVNLTVFFEEYLGGDGPPVLPPPVSP